MMGRELKIIHCWGGLLVQSKALVPALSHHHATTAALHHPPSSSSISLPWTLYTESCECIKWEMYLCTTTTTTKRHSSQGNWQGEKWSDIHAMPLHLYTSHHHHRLVVVVAFCPSLVFVAIIDVILTFLFGKWI